MTELMKERTGAAIDWFMRLCEEDVTEAELSDWIQWCNDPQNLREFQGIRRTWRGFDRLGPAASELLETVLESEPVAAPPRRRSVRRPWLQVMAAALLAVVLAALWYAYPPGWWTQRAQIAAHTEVKSSVLPDGSTLTLAPRTSMALDFTGPHRSLQFASGEAYFKVQPDKDRPFVVHTQGLKVTAIGTAFDVRSEAGSVVVTVQEGLVEVAGTAAADTQVWRLAVGHRITYDTQKRTAHLDTVDLARAMAWHEGRLEYFATPLSAVIADINRYSGSLLELGDPKLGQLKYTGSVFTHAIDDWLAGIETTFALRVLVTRDDHRVLLSRLE